MEKRAEVDEIAATFFHWVGVEIAEDRSIDMHDEENRTRFSQRISKSILQTPTKKEE